MEFMTEALQAFDYNSLTKTSFVLEINTLVETYYIRENFYVNIKLVLVKYNVLYVYIHKF